MNIFAAGPHIEIKAEEIFSIAGFPVSNSMILGFIGFLTVLLIFFTIARKIKDGKKRNYFEKLVLFVYESLYNTVRKIIPEKKIYSKVAPLSIAMFFFIVINYWMGIIPLAGPITVDGVPLLRGPLADLNVPLGLAIVTVVMVQIYAIKMLGFRGNSSRYFVNPFKDFIGWFVGILELISEFSRLLSLSLRLFGNVLAGEILIIVIGFISGMLASVGLVPFYGFELFIGAIQAYIFFILTTVFIAIGFSGHSSEEAEPEVSHSPVVDVKRVSTDG